MLKNLLLAAMTCFGIAIAVLVLTLGGCVAKGTTSAIPEPPRENTDENPAEEPSVLHPGRVARLSAGVTVDAVAFDADAPCGQAQKLRLEPGVWVMPAEVFRAPLPICCTQKERLHE